MILVFGSINTDFVVRVASIPRPGETVISHKCQTLFGGKGANQAIAAARASLPSRVAMVGCVGADAFGQAARENLAQNGVITHLTTVGTETTGFAFINVDALGENAITVVSGANAELTRFAVDRFPIDQSTLAVLQMESPFEETLNVAQRVRALGGRVLWNLAPVPSTLKIIDLKRLLKATDILVVNEKEAFAATDILGVRTVLATEAGNHLSCIGRCVCVVTAGERGALAFYPNGGSDKVEAERVLPKDTTGAGDAFVGILASGLDEALPFTVALARACRGASLSCLSEGAQGGLPTRQQLDGLGP